MINFLNLFYQEDENQYEYTNDELKIIKKLKNVYGSKYNYSKVQNIKPYQKIILICSIHGNFSKTLFCHLLKNNGCPYCKKNIMHDKIMKYYKLI